jgi:deoxyribonuclease-2
MYNDEFPSGSKSDSYGHTKGVAVFGSDKGFWLVHSTPRWPPNRADGYSYAADEQKYGQSFLCLSMTAAELDTVAKCFFNNKAHVYDGYIPESLTSSMPSMTSAITGQHTTDSVATQQSISAGSSSWTQFCKSSEWGKDLYEDLVEPYYSKGFSWETWQNGGTELPSYCAGTSGCSYDSFNVKTLSLPDGTNWDINQDHSKWGVSSTGSVTCIGDINREITQRKRGGGTVCRDSAALHKAFSSIITDTDKTCGSC